MLIHITVGNANQTNGYIYYNSISLKFSWNDIIMLFKKIKTPDNIFNQNVHFKNDSDTCEIYVNDNLSRFNLVTSWLQALWKIQGIGKTCFNINVGAIFMSSF